MPEEPSTLEDVAERVGPNMAALKHCYGAIAFLNERGQITSKGSMVLVRKGSEHFVFTAKHVADNVPGDIVVAPPVTPEESLRGHFSDVIRFPVSEADVAWRARAMDIAALRAPPKLIELAYLRWFDFDDSARAARWLRRTWSADRPFLMVIMGCPNFGHVRTPQLETLSFVPIGTKISTYDRVAWDGFSLPAPQIHLEIDDVNWGLPDGDDLHLSRITAALHAEPERFGGFSGGPLVVIPGNGEFLIGVVTEGGDRFPRAVAVAWDDIASAFESDS